nr:hypothetical protein [Tanacetum cinerariifolium]
KKVIITEDTVRQALRLNDAEIIDCLPKEEIFTELARMGYEKPLTNITFIKAFFSAQWKFLIHTILQCMSAKRIAWNEFSSFMASAVICLATGKGFSGVETPLFEGMLVPQQAADDVANIAADDVDDAVAENAAEPTPPSPTPPPPQELPSKSQVAPTLPPSPIAQSSSPPQQQQPSHLLHDVAISIDLLNTLKLERKNKLKVSRLRRLRKVGTAQRVESSVDTVMDDQEDVLEPIITLLHVSKQENKMRRWKNCRERKGIIADLDADKDVTLEEVDAAKDAKDDEPEPAKLKEVIEVVTTAKLMTKVVADAATTAASTITVAPSAARKRKRIVIRDPGETATPSTIVHSKPKYRDKGKGILVKEPKPLKKQAHIEQDEAYARELEAELNKNVKWDDVIEQNMAGFKMDYFKGMSYDDIHLIFEKYFNSNVAFLEKSKEQLEEEESRALKRKTKSSEKKAVKKKKLDEEVEELKKHLQIVPNEEDDVYTKATPLALKLFLSFLSLLRNFDREDLEMIWQIVQEIFASSKPKNFSDDFLLTTLKAMFKKPDVEAKVWKNQRGIYGLAKVKCWKLLGPVEFIL